MKRRVTRYDDGAGVEPVAHEAHWTGRVELIPSKLDEPLHWRKPARVFVNSMSDLFHEALSWGSIESVFDVMQQSPQHTFQVLTKRADNMRKFSDNWAFHHGGPLPNVWLGVSVEDQKTADERIPLLLQTPAAVRFVSYEPALGPVDFAKVRSAEYDVEFDALHGFSERRVKVDWVIVGGESGPGARPFDVAWARSVVGQCKAAGVACFVKQLGARPVFSAEDPNPFGEIRDRKGGDPAEWPEDLRVRQLPREES